MRVLKHGYYIPFLSMPESYTEKKNKSAPKDPELVEQQIKEWLDLGVTVQGIPVTCINPLSVATRIDGAKVKKRLVKDLSRHMNKRCKKESVKLALFMKSLEVTVPGDWQAVLDLEKTYFHIRMAKEHVQYLGFQHPFEGRDTVFAFKFLPFRLASAVHCKTKIFKPLVARLLEKGIRYSQFINDGRVEVGKR